jgi:predicted enzyme related to lactoylglutathione lyase
MDKVVRKNSSSREKEHKMKFIATRLLVTDTEKQIHFWKDVMGFTMKFGDAAMGYAYFELEGTGIELLERNAFAKNLGQSTPVPTPTGQQVVLDFKVDDVDATYAQLVKRGAEALHEPTDQPEWGNVRVAHLADPEGNIVEIYAPISA